MASIIWVESREEGRLPDSKRQPVAAGARMPVSIDGAYGRPDSTGWSRQLYAVAGRIERERTAERPICMDCSEAHGSGQFHEGHPGGVETHRIEGETVRVYSVAKTIADTFKYRNKIGLDDVRDRSRLAPGAFGLTAPSCSRAQNPFSLVINVLHRRSVVSERSVSGVPLVGRRR
jgi:hypothetical protein